MGSPKEWTIKSSDFSMKVSAKAGSEASGFEWKNVKGQVSALAAAWYLK